MMTTRTDRTQSAPTHAAIKRGRLAPRRSRRGFTLLESAMTLTIIGVGVLAMVEAQQAFIHSNLWSSHAASGAYLGGEVRELMRGLPRHDPASGLSGSPVVFGPETGETTVDDYDDIDDFDGVIFGHNGTNPGPIDAVGRVIPQLDNLGAVVLDEYGNAVAMAGWSQQVLVEKVEPFDTAVVRADDYYRVPPGSDDNGAPIGVNGSGLPPLTVDAFPLRITVVMRYTPDRPDAETTEISRISWIVPRD